MPDAFLMTKNEITFKEQVARGIKFAAIVDTVEQAKEIAGQFPKSLRVKGTSLSTHDKAHYEATGEYRSFTLGYVAFQVSLDSTGVTGEINETGLKRFESFKRHCDRLGYKVESK